MHLLRDIEIFKVPVDFRDEIILNVYGFFEGEPGEKVVVRYSP